MKKILLSAVLLLLGISAFCQQEENGTIYIKHPYIEIVNQSSKGYETQDRASLKNNYADTAKWWSSGMEKFIPIADAMNSWKKIFSISMTSGRFPRVIRIISIIKNEMLKLYNLGGHGQENPKRPEKW